MLYRMSSFTFINDDDDDMVTKTSTQASRAETFRPVRMGLGYSTDMLKKKREKEQEEERIKARILGKKRRKNDPDADIQENEISQPVEEEEESRASAVKKRPAQPTALSELIAAPLSKSQKKRLRIKNKKLNT